MSVVSKIMLQTQFTERKIESAISTKAMYRGWRKIIVNRLGGNKGELLTKGQIKEVKDFYKPYAKVDPIIHQYYYKNTGCFDKRFIPDNLYYSIIDYYFNDWEQAHFLDNKCLYHQLYPGILQPETIISRVNGIWQNWSPGGGTTYPVQFS